MDSPPYTTDMPWRNGYYTGDDVDNPDETWLEFGNINVMTKDPRDATLTDDEKAMMNGVGTFDFCFYYTDSEELATVDSFDWSVYDLDVRQSGGLNERFTIDTTQATQYRVQDKSEIKMWCEHEGPEMAVEGIEFNYTAMQNDGSTEEMHNIQGYKPVTCPPGVKTVFHATTEGGLGDNPTDPKTLTKQQLARSIEFTFEDTSCFTFKYEHYCPCGNYCDEINGGPAEFCKGKGDGDATRRDGRRWCPLSTNDQPDYDPNFPNACKRYTSGNFLFAGSADAKMIDNGECLTPSPTPAPEPTQEPTAPPTAAATPGPTKSPTRSPTTSPTASPTLSPTAAPTDAPTPGPTKSPTVSPTANPTKDPTASPTASPTFEETATGSPAPDPTEEPTASRTVPPRTLPPFEETATVPPRGGDCLDGGVIVKRISGVTEFPTAPSNPVTIIDVGDDDATVTVMLNQFWDTSSSIDQIFASYLKDLYDEVCIEEQDVVGGSMIFDHSITIQCNVMSPWAYLEVCVVDDFAKNVLSVGDDAEVPKCCHPEIPPEHGTVCYHLQIKCSLDCVDAIEEKR